MRGKTQISKISPPAPQSPPTDSRLQARNAVSLSTLWTVGLAVVLSFSSQLSLAREGTTTHAGHHPDEPVVTTPHSHSLRKMGDLDVRIGNGAAIRMPLISEAGVQLQTGFNTTPMTHIGSTWVMNPQNELQFSTGAVLEF